VPAANEMMLLLPSPTPSPRAAQVAEHVPAANEMMLLRNLHAHNCRGVLLSWATLGQPGTGHVRLDLT
jgi:hypothetical protein